jgi:hypothetical protein
MTGLTHRTKQTKLYKWRKANGIQVFTDAAPVRAHILELRAVNVTDSMIAHASECDPQYIAYIADGTTQKMRPDIARRILDVSHIPDPRQHFVLAIGFVRRMRGLTALGWPSMLIAERLGVHGKDKLNNMVRQTAIGYQRWAAMRDLYDELSGTPGPSRRSVAVGRRFQYMPPLAWEGIDIDDPRAQPDWAAAGVKLTDRPMCPNNHLYTADNIYRDNRGNRSCKTCRRNANRRRRQRVAKGVN